MATKRVGVKAMDTTIWSAHRKDAHASILQFGYVQDRVGDGGWRLRSGPDNKRNLERAVIEQADWAPLCTVNAAGQAAQDTLPAPPH
jgi:hypothetical protein